MKQIVLFMIFLLVAGSVFAMVDETTLDDSNAIATSEGVVVEPISSTGSVNATVDEPVAGSVDDGVPTHEPTLSDNDAPKLVRSKRVVAKKTATRALTRSVTKEEVKARLADAKNIAQEANNKAIEICKDRLKKSDANLTEEQIKDKCTKYLSTRLKQLRSVGVAQLRSAQKLYVASKEKYKLARANYIDAKKNIVKAKKLYKTACDNPQSEQCLKVKAQIRAHARPTLINMVDMVLSSLEKVKSNIESSEDIDEDTAQDLISEIDSRISALDNAKLTIENIDENSTKDEIKDAARLIKTEWAKTRPLLKRGVGIAINAKVRNFIGRLDRLEQRLQKVSDKLEENGEDVTRLNELIEEFSKYKEDANNKYELAKEKYLAAKNAKDVDDVLKEADAYLKEARETLRKAYKKTKEIVKEIHSHKNGKETLNAVSVADSVTSDVVTE